MLNVGKVSLGRLEYGVRNQEKCPLKELEVLQKSQWPTFNELFCGVISKGQNPSESQFLVVPARYLNIRLPENLQVWLAQEYRFPVVGGKFEEDFAELNEVTKRYQKLKFNDAHQILKDEIRRSGERVEFLGLKFYERDISSWGAGIIVAVQLYFWLHLRMLRVPLTSNDPSRNIAWIGLYPHYLARLVSLFTVSVVPLGMICYLVIGNNRFSWLAFLLCLVPGLLLACASFWLMLKLSIYQAQI